ncbi:ABC transporter ATP-binding protein [uncultured Thomasclavelia sp.]|uniref:ABC transporter ATP-binding protein n=1 Tax=uncultured Thomasclavelia sp. TaxID=3025759 RepID=UPI0025F33975|nr:ABC transporter ATP-binding protein [uncultured Thomasclavelia sp.]
MSIILEAKGISKTFGYDENKVEAVKEVDLQIEQGTFVAIVGRSGSGKSTLLHILGGLSKPSKGEVLLEGQSLYTMNDDKLTRFRRRRMGFIFQFYNLLPSLNVIENIVLPIHLDGGNHDERYIEEILGYLGLESKKFANISELSGGQQQKVAIARALASKPAIILADEPTGNLDAKSSKEVVEQLRFSKQKYHQTIILVTHDDLIASKADRIITIEDGKIVRDHNNLVG